MDTVAVEDDAGAFGVDDLVGGGSSDGGGGDDLGMFWWQIEMATYELRLQEQLRFWVEPSDGHDDYLMSLALCCRAAQESAAPAAKGVVPPRLTGGTLGRWGRRGW